MEIISRESLLTNSGNKEYLWKYRNEYGNLIFKEFHEKSRFYKNPKLVLERFDVFVYD